MKLDGYLLLSISALAVLILLNFAVPPAASATCTATSPRASLFSHLRRLFPATNEIPAFLLGMSSPLTADQIRTFSTYIDANALITTAHLSAFCSAANVLCSNNLPLGDLDVIYPNGVDSYKKGYSANVNRFIKASHHDPAHLEGLFFREANITAGQKLHIPDIRYNMPTMSFLPKCLSDKLPLSSKSLQGLVELLGLGVSSSMQHAMSRTVSMCEAPSDDGEKKSCVQSIEGMADFAAATVGPKAEVLATESADWYAQDAMVVNALGINGRKVTPTMACHYSMFPYAVYYCHSIPAVKVYQIELLIGNDTEKKTKTAVAVCHMDTSKWSAEHISFTLLGSAPGKTEACHLVFEGEFAWVARHDSTTDETRTI